MYNRGVGARSCQQNSAVHCLNIYSKKLESSTMPHKRKRGTQAIPILGVAGVSLTLAGGASAKTSGQAADIPSQDATARLEITLHDEEISDVSLATFYVFAKEHAGTSRVSEKLAWGCRGCGCGCYRGCGGRGCGCGGCRGCGCGGCRSCAPCASCASCASCSGCSSCGGCGPSDCGCCCPSGCGGCSCN